MWVWVACDGCFIIGCGRSIHASSCPDSTGRGEKRGPGRRFEPRTRTYQNVCNRRRWTKNGNTRYWFVTGGNDAFVGGPEGTRCRWSTGPWVRRTVSSVGGPAEPANGGTAWYGYEARRQERRRSAPGTGGAPSPTAGPRRQGRTRESARGPPEAGGLAMPEAAEPPERSPRPGLPTGPRKIPPGRPLRERKMLGARRPPRQPLKLLRRTVNPPFSSFFSLLFSMEMKNWYLVNTFGSGVIAMLYPPVDGSSFRLPR